MLENLSSSEDLALREPAKVESTEWKDGEA